MDFAFDPVWYWPVGLFVVGVTVFWTGNCRLDKTLKNAGGALALLALAWGVAAYVVETPREKAVTHTKELIEAYKAHDWGKFTGLLDPGTTLARYGNREMIVQAAKRSIDDPGVKETYVLSTESSQQQSHVVVTMTVATTIEKAMGRPVRSTWEFDYVNMGGEWTLTAITPVGFEGQSAETILRQLPAVGK